MSLYLSFWLLCTSWTNDRHIKPLWFKWSHVFPSSWAIVSFSGMSISSTVTTGLWWSRPTFSFVTVLGTVQLFIQKPILWTVKSTFPFGAGCQFLLLTACTSLLCVSGLFMNIICSRVLWIFVVLANVHSFVQIKVLAFIDEFFSERLRRFYLTILSGLVYAQSLDLIWVGRSGQILNNMFRVYPCV